MTGASTGAERTLDAPLEVPTRLREQRHFLRLWLGQSINQLGDQVYLLALPLIVLELTGSGSHMSLVYAAGVLPYFLLGLIGGSLADTGDRRALLVRSNLVAAGLLLAASASALVGGLQLSMVYVLSLSVACLVSFVLPAFESAVPDVVPPPLLTRANGLAESTTTALTVAGPAAAGLLLTLLPGTTALAVDGLTFLVTALVFAGLPGGLLQHAAAECTTGVRARLQHVWQGLVFVPRHEVLRWGMYLSTTSNFVLGAYETVLIFHLSAERGLSPAQVGLVLAATGAAAVAAALVVASRGLPGAQGRWIVGSLAVQGMATVLVGALDSLAGLVLAQAVHCAALGVYQVAWRSLRQHVTPAGMLGRVSGACRGVAYLGVSLGAVVTAVVLALDTAPRTLFVVEGAIVVLLAASGLPLARSRAPEVRRRVS